MAHWPSALACQASRPSRSDPPTDWMAKSTMVVVPPQAAARVPVSKVSAATVPPNGISMWVCPSTPPGITYLPVASSSVSACQPCATDEPVAASATTCSPSISTSAAVSSAAVITRPLRMTVVLTGSPR